MKYVFGPVPSRRLGQSLGIDTIPIKTCNWNCVYCQLGRTVPLTNQRREYIPSEDIFSEIEIALTAQKSNKINWITFVGSGEPTLHSDLGKLIRKVKTLTDIPVAVITNGSLLYQQAVRAELSAADAVLPSLDAGNPRLYRQINRPHPEVTFDRLLDGLITFRDEYQGKLWIEVMLVRDLNDTEPALMEIAAALQRIQSVEVHILQPIRPSAEIWVQPSDDEGLLRACSILGDIASVVHPATGPFDLSSDGSLVDALIGVITRHPMSENDLIHILRHYSPEEVA